MAHQDPSFSKFEQSRVLKPGKDLAFSASFFFTSAGNWDGGTASGFFLSSWCPWIESIISNHFLKNNGKSMLKDLHGHIRIYQRKNNIFQSCNCCRAKSWTQDFLPIRHLFQHFWLMLLKQLEVRPPHVHNDKQDQMDNLLKNEFVANLRQSIIYFFS